MSLGQNPPLIWFVATDLTGKPSPNAKLYHFVTRSSIPKNIYSDVTLQTPLPQPLIADGQGLFEQFFLEPGAYRFVMFTEFNDQLRAPADPVFGAGGGSSADYPDPTGSGFLFYNDETDTYTWTTIPADEHTVKVNDSDSNPGTLVEKVVSKSPGYLLITAKVDNSQLELEVVGAPPVGPAGGDLAGTYPDPIVRQLTGVGSGLATIETDFEWPANPGGAFPLDQSGGRGIAAGRAFIAGLEKNVWLAQGNRGDLRWTTDFFKNTVDDQSLRLAFPAITNWNGLCFQYMAGMANYAWIATNANEAKFFYALHTSANYNSDGTLKTSAWTFVSYAAGTPNQPVDMSGDGPIMCYAGNDYEIGRTVDFVTFTVALTAPDIIGGIGNDSYGTWLACLRTSGLLYRSLNGGATWAPFPDIFVDGVAAIGFPIDHGEIWGSILGCYGLWVATNYVPNPGAVSYVYSTDGVHWFSFTGEITSFYLAAFDGVRIFATNPASLTANPVLQLLVSAIPVHMRLALEQGMAVAGDTFLTDLPDAAMLNTDVNGKVRKQTMLQFKTAMNSVPRQITAAYTVQDDDETIIFTGAVAYDVTIASSLGIGRKLTIKRGDSNTAWHRIVPTGATIDGAANFQFSTAWQSVTIQCVNSTTYVVISQ